MDLAVVVPVDVVLRVVDPVIMVVMVVQVVKF
jgi:hypothetical protein